jgi:hypothetical protein
VHPPSSLRWKSPSLKANSIVLLLALLPLPAAEAASGESRVQAPEGFVARDLLHFGTNQFIGGLLALGTQGLVVYDGVNVVLSTFEGGTIASEPVVLFTPDDPPFFGSFLRLAPDGAFVYFGGTRTGDKPHSIYRIPLSPAGPAGAEEVDRIRFNYDLAFDDRGRAFVSSLEIGSENRIFLLDGDPAAQSDPVVVNIPGYSGPLLFGDGKLYYATAVPEAGKNTVVYFTAEQIEEGIGEGKEIDFQQALAENRLAVVAQNVDPYFNLVFAGGMLLASGPPEGIVRLLPDGSVELFASAPLDGGFNAAVTFLTFRPGKKEFLPGAGPEGGSLYLSVSDFTNFNDLVEVTPELHFRRGYINADPLLDLTDAVDLLGYLYLQGVEPDPPIAGDLNDDGKLDVSDPIYLLAYLFTGGDEPPAPFHELGPDPTL